MTISSGGRPSLSAAKRNTANTESLDFEVIGQADNVASQQLERIWTRGRLGSTVSSAVVTNDAERPGQRVQLPLPHRDVRAQRIREHQHGRVGRTLDFVVDGYFANVRKHYGDFLS